MAVDADMATDTVTLIDLAGENFAVVSGKSAQGIRAGDYRLWALDLSHSCTRPRPIPPKMRYVPSLFVKIDAAHHQTMEVVAGIGGETEIYMGLRKLFSSTLPRHRKTCLGFLREQEIFGGKTAIAFG